MHACGAGKALLAQLVQEDIERLLRRKGLPEFTPKTLTKPHLLFAEHAISLFSTAVRKAADDLTERIGGSTD